MSRWTSKIHTETNIFVRYYCIWFMCLFLVRRLIISSKQIYKAVSSVTAQNVASVYTCRLSSTCAALLILHAVAATCGQAGLSPGQYPSWGLQYPSPCDCIHTLEWPAVGGGYLTAGLCHVGRDAVGSWPPQQIQQAHYFRGAHEYLHFVKSRIGGAYGF